jgi:hypothetical protein
VPLNARQRRALVGPCWFGGWLSLAVASLVPLSCATGPEHLLLVDPSAKLATSAEWQASLGSPAATATPTSALVVGASRSELIAARLDRDTPDEGRWSVDAAVTAGPVIAAGLVLFGAGDEVRVLSAEDGQARRSLPAPGSVLLAATVSRSSTALLLADSRGERVLSVFDQRSRERLRISAESSLSAPAFFEGALLVPWADGYVSAVDVSRAAERARVRVGESPVQPLALNGELFFGGPPWVDPKRPGAPLYVLPRRPLPGVIQSGAVPPAPDVLGSQPAEPVRLVVHPGARAEPARTSVYMATFGRVAFGLEREHGALAWVTALPGRALAAAPVEGGFVVCDDSGSVRWLAELDGRIERSWQLVRRRRTTVGEKTLSGCAIASGKMLPPDASSRGARVEPELLEQLARVLALSDPELTEAQRFLARELAARPEPEATRVLIDLVTRNSLDQRLQSEAEDLLATRRNGQGYMLEALSPPGTRADDGARLPPIAPLGEALAALGEERAAPLLARQLNRPAHTALAVARAAAALERLASAAEYAELSVFFSLHRTTADGPEWVAAVLSSARALRRIGGEEARTLLAFAQRDPLTVEGVRSALERELGAPTGSIRSRTP